MEVSPKTLLALKARRVLLFLLHIILTLHRYLEKVEC
jgi:hypothetical protein